jgi:hypothetical protein
MSKSAALCILPILCFLSVEVAAGVRPVPGSESLPSLFNSASFVFAGKIVSVEPTGGTKGENGEPAHHSFEASILVDRQYKGEGTAKTVKIIYNRPDDPACFVSQCESHFVGDDRLFLLVKRDDGYRLLDQFSGQFAISMLKAPHYRPGLPGLESDLIAGLHETDEGRLLTNIELIGGMEGIGSTSPLTELLKSNNDPDVQAATYLALLRLHNYRRLRESLAFAEENSKMPLALSFKGQICDWAAEIRDPTTVSTLVDFANSRSDRVREPAVHALREMASPQAVPVFIKKLDDPVQLIRYDAVLGLATVEKNWGLAPSGDAFAADETKYISAWKSWWARSGRTSYDGHRN